MPDDSIPDDIIPDVGGREIHPDGTGQITGNVGALRQRLITLPRMTKRVLLVAHDLLALGVALWLAMSVRLNALYVPETLPLAMMLALAPVLAVLTFFWFGLYRLVTRYLGPHGLSRLLACLALSITIWGLFILITGVGLPSSPYGVIPRSLPIAYFVAGGAFIIGSRSACAWLLHGVEIKIARNWRRDRSVLIWGAETTGVQLLEAFARTGEARVAGFLDESPNLWGQYVAGVKVYRPDPSKIARLIERESVTEVVLAKPRLKRRDQQAILRQLQQFPVKVQMLPSIADLASGRIAVSSLRPVQVDDLLGRDPVPPNPELLARSIRGKSVMVTGAGGSIGAELVRQIVRQGPAKIVLLDHAEPALYEIEMEVADLTRQGDRASAPAVVSVLGSVAERPLVDRLLRQHDVHTVYHAAAYKHVPIVETNPGTGILNNTFGTKVMADAARDAGVERFVLISTDKAVRPTNVMGASKRLAELVLQAHAADPGCETVFTMVRFGNVLNSSGSVVRRFRGQIESGGPITVTHPEITRYFMSIPEAAELVIQAGAMARGGEVFLLEMGEPVKIDDLARTMIRLVGLDVRDASNPDGDIEIVYTGLRPGEKLYEELLIGEGAVETEHPRIKRSSEPHLPVEELDDRLAVLTAAIGSNDGPAIEALLLRTVEGYQPEPQGVDMARGGQIAAVSRTLH